MEIQELEELELTSGQISVYSAVLELGKSSLNGIHEKTGIERRNIYDILNKLIERGMVSYVVESGRKNYQVTHPNKIKEEIDLKRDKINQLEAKLPKIQDLFNLSKPHIRAEVFRGDEAIKAIHNEALEFAEIYYIGGTSFGEYSAVSQNLLNWFNHWMKRRLDKKIMMYDLVDFGKSLKGLSAGDVENHKKNYYKRCELPKNLESPLIIMIYGNKVAQILWSKQPFAFVLESVEIKQGFMKYFNYFWKEPW